MDGPKGRRRWASEAKGVRRHISREINLCQEGRRAAWEGQDRNDAEEGIRYSGSRFRKSGGLRMNSSESNRNADALPMKMFSGSITSVGEPVGEKDDRE